MGAYLTTGVVQNIIIYKKQLVNYDITIDKIIAKLREEVNIDYYSYSEDSNGYYWHIDPKMLEGNFVEFLETQFQMYSNKTSSSRKYQEIEEAIDKVKEAKTGNELIELAASISLQYFQLVDYTNKYISVLHNNNFKLDILVNFHLIAFFIDGKIIMECYYDILRYFSQNIHLQREKYPVADCIIVLITD
ncbi:hypothetical protein [Rickettsia endosymbiont of Orchestes rusci]|uniref:hypothetical protein n=1 Tax=Rickettsia endosymbiont of Orchestes rusci TaxID=3066250 RepID=UPI00313F1392